MGYDSLAGRKITRQIDEEPIPIGTDQWNAAYLTKKGLHKRPPPPVIKTGKRLLLNLKKSITLKKGGSTSGSIFKAMQKAKEEGNLQFREPNQKSMIK